MANAGAGALVVAMEGSVGVAWEDSEEEGRRGVVEKSL
mgnify:CR=1 FL=1